MIPSPAGARVWLAAGHTDMRRGMNGLALQVQHALGRDPHAGDLYVFRGKRGSLVKIELMQPEAVAAFIESFTTEWNRLSAEMSAQSDLKQRELPFN